MFRGQEVREFFNAQKSICSPIMRVRTICKGHSFGEIGCRCNIICAARKLRSKLCLYRTSCNAVQFLKNPLHSGPKRSCCVQFHTSATKDAIIDFSIEPGPITVYGGFGNFRICFCMHGARKFARTRIFTM